MDEKREEIYERIPWETLEKPSMDRQTLVVGVAVAVVVGALAYSFMSNRAVAPPAETVAPAGAIVAPTTPTTPLAQPPAAVVAPGPVVSANPAPQVMSEADLYALEPEKLEASAAALAEFFVIEYLTFDGTPEGQSILRNLMPADVPLPTADEASLVFVEWVGSVSVDGDVTAGTFTVDVLARYMVADEGSTYRRVPPEIFAVRVRVDDSGGQILGPPESRGFDGPATAALGLVEVPPEITARVEEIRPQSQVVGGQLLSDGTWRVVVITTGPGLSRPETISIAP